MFTTVQLQRTSGEIKAKQTICEEAKGGIRRFTDHGRKFVTVEKTAMIFSPLKHQFFSVVHLSFFCHQPNQKEQVLCKHKNS
jgi:hypothetical protein